jgi:formylglycine-generating enzyme required for sulfatase activity
VMGSNPSRDYGVGANHPVYFVSWNYCQTFINRLNQMDQGKFRLPTEAEWEYACRAGTQTHFYWGDDTNYSQIKDYAWCDGNNSPYGTKEVGQKLPNAYGLHDMSGNVWEWCQDWFGSYSSNSQTDPTGSTSGSNRVLRGGGWLYDAQYCRSAYRYNYSPNNRIGGIGFRVLLERSHETLAAQSINFDK